MRELLESCEKFHIDLQILGAGKPYPGNGQKIILMLEHLETLNDNDVALFVDAFDTLILAEPDEILNKFLNAGRPFVLSTEKKCYPLSNLTGKFPSAPTPFRYINTGCYIGYVHFLKILLTSLNIAPNVSDQRQVTKDYFKHHSFYYPNLDFHCDFFLCLYALEEGEIMIDENTHRLQCLTTGSYPCVVHANGKSFEHWYKIYNAYFGENPRE